MVPLLSGIKKVMDGSAYELIVVDGSRDGPSTDRTVGIAKRYGARILYANEGKGLALLKGLRAARGQVLVSMDADLSHKPNELRLLIAGIEAGYDLCVGSRFLFGGGTSDMTRTRMVVNKTFVFLVNTIYGSKYTDMCYGYRSFSRSGFRRMKLKELGLGIEAEINIKAQKAGLRIIEVPSFEKKRAAEKAKVIAWKAGFSILSTIFKNMG